MSERSDLPKVSIGLPVRNGEAYLAEALESLAMQDYPNLEIIVSDNGSTDGTKDILAAAMARFPSIRVFTQTETLAATDNFTFVLDKASGEFFCWAADDDVRAPGSIASLAGTLDSHPELVCVMSDVVNRYEGTGQRTVDLLEGIRLEKVLADWPSVRRLFFEVPTSNVFFCVYGLYRTEALRRVRMKMNLGFSANTEIPMLAQVALLGGIASIAEEGFIYRRHAESIYHKEVAQEDPREPYRRRRVLRRVVSGILMRSRLELTEKFAILVRIWQDHYRDFHRDRSRIKTSELRAAANIQLQVKSKRNPVRNLWLRVKRRLRRRLFGSPPVVVKPVPVKPEVPPPPDEVLVSTRPKLSPPDLRDLVLREKARRRLEGRGWRFEPAKRIRLLFENEIKSVVDCGANTGQFVANLRKAGWSGEVFSFEPLGEEYSKLAEKASSAPGWRTFQCALGASAGEAEINVAGNSYSSSLLPFSKSFTELRPDASPVRSEVIQVRRLDDVVREEALEFKEPILLKLDVQGFELNVLRGAEQFLKRVRLIQTEMALVPSYEGAPDFWEIRRYLSDHGFALIHLIDGHNNHITGELREVDGIFVNTSLSEREGR